MRFMTTVPPFLITAFSPLLQNCKESVFFWDDFTVEQGGACVSACPTTMRVVESITVSHLRLGNFQFQVVLVEPYRALRRRDILHTHTSQAAILWISGELASLPGQCSAAFSTRTAWKCPFCGELNFTTSAKERVSSL